MAKYDVLALGDYYIDYIFTGLPSFPELGKEVFSQQFAAVPGGTYNAVIAMHRLGVKVGWAGDFGNDEFSKQVMAAARQEGLDCSLFEVHKQALRKITVSASFADDRAFISYCDPDPALPAGLKRLPTTSARVLFLPGLYTGDLLEVGSRLVKLKGMKLVMDGNSSHATLAETPGLEKVLRLADVFMPNAREARRITGLDDLEGALRRLGEFCRLVVVKDGANGSYACQNQTITYARGMKVEPVDTTGAGDCFDAGFITAWLEGKPMALCLKWGNVVGALSTTALGGTGRVITRNEVETCLKNWEG
ncbi:MAG TPA: carbohydrate kinase family protein [Anaerolineaceae bacterium]|nr:carbohydrate kinase family protein [Anaerolineaceae bacterium]HPN51140.1 carbohydrate kinase family protein [Anaerolineaceae bacterium]